MNQGDFYILEKYFMNELDESKRKEVELRIQSDKDFRSDSEEVKLLITGIQRFEEQDIRQKMKGWDHELQEKKIPGKFNKSWQKWGAVAAAVVVLMATVFIFQNRQSKTEELFHQYYNLPQTPLISARGENELILIKKTAFEAFNDNDYTLALNLFNEYLELEDEREIRFYYAISLFEVGEHSRSTQQLEILNKGSSNPEYQWYLALFYLHDEKITEATALFKELKNSPEYSTEATNLLKKMQ